MVTMQLFHVVLTCYGNWMPDDARGSWSPTRATPGGQESYDLARAPRACLNRTQGKELADSLRRTARRYGIKVYHCAILPAHIHLMIASRDIRRDVRLLKGRATADLRAALNGQRLWARRAWIEELRSEEHVAKARQYIVDNLPKSGLPEQDYPWLTPWTPE